MTAVVADNTRQSLHLENTFSTRPLPMDVPVDALEFRDVQMNRVDYSRKQLIDY
jgi:hypothetical protein